jgi:hypothetical protein
MSNLQQAHIQPIAVSNVNIRQVQELSLKNRWIKVHNVSPISGTMLDVLEQLYMDTVFKKVCAQ